LNAYAWSTEEAGSTFGVEGGWRPDRARVTGTFSYISTYAAFLTTAWVLGWLAVLHAPTRLQRRFAGLVLVLIGFNMAMNGSRWLLTIAAVSGLPFTIAMLRGMGTLRSQILVASLIGLAVFFGASDFEPFALTAERGDPEEALTRILGALMSPIATFTQVDLFGMGLGYTFGGFEQLGVGTSYMFDEINLDRVGIEVGAIAYAFVLFLKVAMLAKTVHVWRQEPRGRLRNWTLAALLVQINSIWQIPFYNSVAAIFYFSALGFVYWLGGRQRLQQAQARKAFMLTGATAVPVYRGG